MNVAANTTQESNLDFDSSGYARLDRDLLHLAPPPSRVTARMPWKASYQAAPNDPTPLSSDTPRQTPFASGYDYVVYVFFCFVLDHDNKPVPSLRGGVGRQLG